MAVLFQVTEIFEFGKNPDPTSVVAAMPKLGSNTSLGFAS